MFFSLQRQDSGSHSLFSVKDTCPCLHPSPFGLCPQVLPACDDVGAGLVRPRVPPGCLCAALRHPHPTMPPRATKGTRSGHTSLSTHTMGHGSMPPTRLSARTALPSSVNAQRDTYPADPLLSLSPSDCIYICVWCVFLFVSPRWPRLVPGVAAAELHQVLDTYVIRHTWMCTAKQTSTESNMHNQTNH